MRASMAETSDEPRVLDVIEHTGHENPTYRDIFYQGGRIRPEINSRWLEKADYQVSDVDGDLPAPFAQRRSERT